MKAQEVSTGPALMWNDPKDLRSRDLFYGPGGKEHAPKGTFTFVEEDREGSSPKFVVRDEEGRKWKAKLGLEARPETVCTRLLWAVGYYANEDYFVRDLKVVGMPPHLHRGQEFVDADGSVHNVRLKREDKKIGIWRWRHDAFTGTRELNGLRVLMAVINNWDLKDVNNAIYQVGPDRIYMVSDLGASFGSAGRTWPPAKGKDNLESYRKSKFIRRLTADSVDFATPARPTWKFLGGPAGSDQADSPGVDRQECAAGGCKMDRPTAGPTLTATDPRCVPRRWILARRDGTIRQADRGTDISTY